MNIEKALDPLRGVLRGVYPGYPNEKVVGITCGELRKIHILLVQMQQRIESSDNKTNMSASADCAGL